MKGFDDHLDNYGDPNPGDDDEPPFYPERMIPLNLDDDGITTDDFDNWPLGREFPS